jgi:hypothetical protein
MNVDDLLYRARQALTQLQFISEARAATPPDKKHGGQQKASSREPTMSGLSEYDFHFVGIERMVAAAERGVEIAKRREKQEPESKEQFRHRVIERYEGSSPQHVADKENITLSLVYKIRAEACRVPSNGRIPE